jgi:hypothetical protein
MKGVAADSCGCEMGGRFLIVALPIFSIYYGILVVIAGYPTLEAIGRAFVLTFLVATAGKILGILLYRWRQTRQAPARHVLTESR